MQKNILICAVILVSLIASIGLAQSDNPASGMQVNKNTLNTGQKIKLIFEKDKTLS